MRPSRYYPGPIDLTVLAIVALVIEAILR